MTFTPQSENEAAEIILAAKLEQRQLAICGNDTKSAIGKPVGDVARLSSSALSGITSYNPAEMVMTARAGTPLAEILAALDANRQMLAFEPPDYRGIHGSAGEATIGGLFASNLSGPRRFQAGAARDHLIGVRFVNGLGEIVQAGGRVMKNVTGLDLVKLMAGSFGTLAFMTELTFKVVPKPEMQASLVVSGLDDEEATFAMAKALGLPYEISGAAHLPESCRGQFVDGRLPQDGGATVLRLEGPAFSVRERMDKLRSRLQFGGGKHVLEQEESAALWKDIRDVKPFHADGTQRPIWKISVAPSVGHRLLFSLQMEIGVNGYYDWQGGLLWLRMESEPAPFILRHYVNQQGGGHATLIRGSEKERENIASFEPLSPAVAALTDRIRLSFDPSSLFFNRMR